MISSNHNTHLPLIVFVIILCICVLVFSGFPSTDDEQLFAIITRNLGAGNGYSALPLFGNDRLQGRTGSVEPLHPVLGVPLFFLALQFGLGKAQVLHLLPAVYTALTCGLLTVIALKKGFSRHSALMIGVAYGSTTIALPYARTNFREPLAALFITCAALFLEFSRSAKNRQGQQKILFGALSVTALGFSALTKITTAVLIPIFLAAFLADLQLWKKETRKKTIITITAAGIAAASALFLLQFLLPVSSLNRFSVRFLDYLRYTLPRLPHDHFWLALAGLFFSPGKGLFIYSPFLILTLIGFFIKMDRKMDRCLYFSSTAILAAVQALIYNDQWWGITWGTRALLPVLPLVMLATLPALESLAKKVNKLLRFLPFSLLAVGGIIQVSRLITTDPVFANWAVRTSGASISAASQWDLTRMPLIQHWLLSDPLSTSDIAWLHISRDAYLLVILLILLAAIGIISAVCALKRKKRRHLFQIIMILAASAALVLTPFASRFDRRYFVDNPSFQKTTETICAQAEGDDLILIDAYLQPYWWYYFNYGCKRPHWLGLPYLHKTAIQRTFIYPRASETALQISAYLENERQVFLVQSKGLGLLTYQEELTERGFSLAPINNRQSTEQQIFTIH